MRSGPGGPGDAMVAIEGDGRKTILLASKLKRGIFLVQPAGYAVATRPKRRAASTNTWAHVTTEAASTHSTASWAPAPDGP